MKTKKNEEELEFERVEKVLENAMIKNIQETLTAQQGGQCADCGEQFLSRPHIVFRNGKSRAVCCDCVAELRAGGVVVN